jgi:hypothetical protein
MSHTGQGRDERGTNFQSHPQRRLAPPRAGGRADLEVRPTTDFLMLLSSRGADRSRLSLIVRQVHNFVRNKRSRFGGEDPI